MKHKFKALGLAFVAVLAMSAVAAGSAQALTQGQFTAAAYPAVATGKEVGGPAVNFFQTTGPGGPKVTCANVSYEATLAEASTSLKVTPHYTNCEASSLGGVTAVIDLNGCYFEFKAGTNTSATDTHGTAAVVGCTDKKPITVTVGGVCAIDVPEQGNLGGVTFTNVANGDVTVDVDVTNQIKYTERDLSFFCPNASPHTTGDGNFFSHVHMEGFVDKGTEVVTTTNDSGGDKHEKVKYLHEGARNIDVR